MRVWVMVDRVWRFFGLVVHMRARISSRRATRGGVDAVCMGQVGMRARVVGGRRTVPVRHRVRVRR